MKMYSLYNTLINFPINFPFSTQRQQDFNIVIFDPPQKSKNVHFLTSFTLQSKNIPNLTYHIHPHCGLGLKSWL